MSESEREGGGERGDKFGRIGVAFGAQSAWCHSTSGRAAAQGSGAHYASGSGRGECPERVERFGGDKARDFLFRVGDPKP